MLAISRSHALFAVYAIGGGCICADARAAEYYQTDLGPLPLNEASKLVIHGRGAAMATLDGNKLSVSGRFDGFYSPATTAHLCLGLAMGAPGICSMKLSAAAATNGTVVGDLILTAKEVAALRDGRFYIRTDSETAPAGNLWGWLQPRHETVAPDVPQAGQWYLPDPLNK